MFLNCCGCKQTINSTLGRKSYSRTFRKTNRYRRIDNRRSEVPEDKNSYSDYFAHNSVIVEVLSLFGGFLFTSITILLTSLQSRGSLLGQATILFLTLVFYFSLYVLLDNLEMAFHYIDDIPPLTLKVRPFFSLLLVFYSFGSSTILMFLLFDLFYLAVISGVIWALIVIYSINTTVKRFYKQSVTRYWKKDS
jgi:hypothetical protein